MNYLLHIINDLLCSRHMYSDTQLMNNYILNVYSWGFFLYYYYYIFIFTFLCCIPFLLSI